MKKFTEVLIFSIITVFFISCDAPKGAERVTLSKKLLSPKLLNSERIKSKFGSYGIDVLSQTNKVRVSNLYSVQEDDTITRTFAVVSYTAQMDSSYATIHSKIVGGASIGRIFKKNGWQIKKMPLFEGKIDAGLNDFSYVYDLMAIRPDTLAYYMYDFYIQKNDRNYKYATITEVYHPHYINPSTLKLLNEKKDVPAEKTSEVDKILGIVYRKMQHK